jgi:ferrous iron transport protein A
MVFNFMKESAKTLHRSLSDLSVGEGAILEEFHVPANIAEHLMNLGFIPGLEVFLTRTGPGGNPRVYRVDGTDVALRRDLSRCISVRPLHPADSR